MHTLMFHGSFAPMVVHHQGSLLIYRKDNTLRVFVFLVHT
jgi:hypothetical protein